MKYDTNNNEEEEEEGEQFDFDSGDEIPEADRGGAPSAAGPLGESAPARARESWFLLSCRIERCRGGRNGTQGRVGSSLVALALYPGGGTSCRLPQGFAKVLSAEAV